MKYQGKITDPKDLVTKEYVDTGLSGKLGTSGDGSNVTAAFNAASSRTNISTGEKLTVIFGKIAKWFTDLGAAAFRGVDSVPTANSTNLAESGGVKSALNFVPETGNAGFHNSIYRGKSLGSSVTAAQYAAISAGTFDDLFIGDYWTINSVNWRIAHFDYWYNKGDTACTTHHVVIVPDELLATGIKLNSTNITTRGYMGSDFYTGNNSNTGRATARTRCQNAFGSAHILTHRLYLINAVTSGYPSGGAWANASVELMDEINIYGCYIYTSAINGTASPNKNTIDNSQFALFAHEPSHMCMPSSYWLRGVASTTDFARFISNGVASSANASSTLGVRPAFAICA